MNRENSGLIILNGSAEHLDTKTVIVLGAARGGTSMIAGTLSKLGVYMGEGLNSRYQDNVLSDCMNRGDKKRARKVISERNKKHSIWGVKKIRLWRWNSLFRNVAYVIVFRDILSVSNRQASIKSTSVVFQMIKVLGKNLSLIIFLTFCRRPVLLVSYEKCLLNPEKFVLALSRFLGLRELKKIPEAIKFIEPSAASYINSSVIREVAQRDGEYLGNIDSIELNKVEGWCLSKSKKKVVELSLFVNGGFEGKVITNVIREDVLKVHPKCYQKCGFIFYFSAANYLKDGDEIDVRVQGDEESFKLINSPQKFILKM